MSTFFQVCTEETRHEQKRVRDNMGRFVMGHEPLVRPKYELMRKHPKLLCDTCCIRSTCPDYQKSCVCAQKREFKKFNTRDVNAVVEMLCTATEKDLTEMQISLIREAVYGVYDQKVSRLMARSAKRLMLLYQIYTLIDRN